MIMTNSCEGGLFYIPFPTMPSPVAFQQHYHQTYIRAAPLDAPFPLSACDGNFMK